MLNGLYGAAAKKRPGPGGLAIGQANLAVSKVGEYFIYAVFVFGILLVLMADDDDRSSFGDTWVWLSILLYVVAIGFSHGFQLPERRSAWSPWPRSWSRRAAARGRPGPAAAGRRDGGDGQEAGQRRRRFLNLDAGGILYLMIFKPGFG